MEFEEMKKIWDSQNNEPIYGINEKALHNRILSKKNQALHITNISELLGIVANMGGACLIFGINFFGQKGNVFMYLLSAWMFTTALYLLVSRIRRRKAFARFDRSMLGDLHHAISLATYQVRFSRLMRWNALPIAIFVFLGIWDKGKPVWVASGVLIFFVLVNYAAGWEHNIYERKKLELEILQKKLENEG
ncbi:MAG: hypothetical protein ABI707_07405 [Ferruginibacter sp.]